jgi:pSer/pThr/pTyr-binding forkhead associated (FHA) protein
VKHGKVYVRDLKSRNGTIVNGEKIDSDTELHTGDQVQVGPLHFEVLVDHSLGGEKKPKVKSVKEAAARATASSRETIEVDESDITDWLDEADELDRARRLTDPETRQLKLDETDQVQLQKAIEESAKKPVDKPAEEEETKEMTEKKKPGKLPKLPDKKTANSRDAAADMLKQFFNNR